MGLKAAFGNNAPSHFHAIYEEWKDNGRLIVEQRPDHHRKKRHFVRSEQKCYLCLRNNL